MHRWRRLQFWRRGGVSPLAIDDGLCSAGCPDETQRLRYHECTDSNPDFETWRTQKGVRCRSLAGWVSPWFGVLAASIELRFASLAELRHHVVA